MLRLPDPLEQRLASRLLIATPVAGAAAAVIWGAQLSTIEILLLVYAAGAVVDVLGVWWEERARARQAFGTPEGIAKLVGVRGMIAASSGEQGTIRIGFELWEARSATGEPLAAGQRVVVQRASGRTLFVQPVR